MTGCTHPTLTNTHTLTDANTHGYTYTPRDIHTCLSVCCFLTPVFLDFAFAHPIKCSFPTLFQSLTSVCSHLFLRLILFLPFILRRDSLLASLLDGVRASGNRDVCVKMAPTRRGQRWGLLSMPVDEEVESLHLKFLAAPPSESPSTALRPPHASACLNTLFSR